MSTPDTRNIGVKLQAAGENLNTWGDPNLNNDLIVLSNLASKFNSLTINVGATTTISETNYSTSNDTEVALMKLTAGTIAAAFSLVFPGRQKCLPVFNACGYASTIKLAATTGFTLPNNRIALVATDGSADVINATPNYGGVTTPTSGSLDIPAWSAVETAIANATFPATAGTVLVDGTDTTAGYIGTKLSLVSANSALVITPSTTSPGGNETKVWTFTAGALGLSLQTEQTAGFTAVAGRIYPCKFGTAQNITMPATAAQGDTIGFDMYGTAIATWLLNGLKYYGSTSAPATSANGVQIFRYTNAATGWIDL